MSASQFDEFDRRMHRINRRHSKMSHGYVTKINDDGLVVAKPAKKSRNVIARATVIVIAMIILFKGVLHAQLGPEAYAERVQSLSEGSPLEQAGSFIMRPDPITLWISGHAVSLVR